MAARIQTSKARPKTDGNEVVTIDAMQMDLFDFLPTVNEKPKSKNKLLNIGDEIGRVVLGELRVARVTGVEGLPLYPFYRTDSGSCYTYEEGLHNIEDLRTEAEEARKRYKIIIPCNLEQRLTVEYPPRTADGRITWAQIGIIGNMLFWKEGITYQFLEPYDNEKKLLKAYEEHKKKITEFEHTVIAIEHKMRRLYWSRHGFYADAEYVKFNG